MLYFRRTAFLMLLGLVFLFIQGTIFRPLLPFSLPVSNMLVVVVVFLSFYEVTPFGVILSFLIGLEMDLASAQPIGPWAGSYVFLFGFLTCIAQRMFVESIPTVAVIAFLASLVVDMMHLAMSLVFSKWPEGVVGIMFFNALFTAILSPFVFGFSKVVFMRADPKRGRNFGLRMS